MSDEMEVKQLVEKKGLVWFIAKQMELAKDSYYNSDTPLISDEDYDYLEEQLKRLAPFHPILTQVGAPVSSGSKVKLPIPLSSLDKIDATSLPKWLNKFPSTLYHISDKIDGISALWMPNGKLYTRGTSIEGTDISEFVPYIQGLKRSPEPIRGELVMKENSTYVPEGKLARNIVSGLLHSSVSDVDKNKLKEVEFVAYELFSGTPIKPSDSFKRMEELGFTVSASRLVPSVEMTDVKLKEYFDSTERTSPYQLDGIVIVPDVPRNNLDILVRNNDAVSPKDKVAWKIRLTSKTATTIVTGVEWNVSAGGLLKPTVLFETVFLSGANINRATGIHFNWINTNGIGKGAVIEVERANDTIPKIVSVIEPVTPDLPLVDYTVIGLEARVTESSAEQDIAKLVKSLEALKVKDVGPGTVKKLYAAGFTTVGDLYSASSNDFTRAQGIKEKSAENIYNGLRHGISTWNILSFMVASNVFPELVGKTKLQLLLDLEPDPQDWKLDDLLRRRPKGISPEVLQSIIKALPKYFEWVDENITGEMYDAMAENYSEELQEYPEQDEDEDEEASVTSESSRQPRSVASGGAAAARGGESERRRLTIVLTGFRDVSLAQRYNLKDNVTKTGVDYVVYKGERKETGSIKKAEQYGIPVIEVSELP